jgi:predicted nicotinamide N-methyase
MENDDEEWIESPTGWGPRYDGPDISDDGGLPDLFASDDTEEYYIFRMRVDGTTASKTVRLHGYKLDSEETYRSTGVTLWQAAPRLADYLQNHPEVCGGRSVLELGAGLGLCGIAAHFCGATTVVMTDGDTQTLLRMRENVRRNCDNGIGDASITTTERNAISCRQLIWGSPYVEKFLERHGRFDRIIGADVIYTRESVLPLLDTVVCMLKKPHGQFVLSRFCQWNNVDDEIVIEAAKLRCLDCTRPSEGIYVFGWNDI